MGKKQTLIGISVCIDPGRVINSPGVDYLYVRRDYSRAVKAAGGTPILLTPDMAPDVAASMCDGVVITGGYDIPADLYGGQPHPSMECVESTERVHWDWALIDACNLSGTPILGICYGMQLLNVHDGGTLYQDISSQVPGAHKHVAGTPEDEHIVSFSQDFLGYRMGESTPSASRHHQAVRDLAEGWEVTAKARDGVIEGMQNGRHYGVQWHSESDETARKIYGEFVAACQLKPLISYSTTS